jgi:flagellin
MVSIITNRSALAALDTLRTVDHNMKDTQSRIASGYRVNTASDNAAYWSIATTMHSDDQALSAVQDALGLGAATVDVAYTGMKNAIDVITTFKAKLVAAREPGVDRDKVNAELVELRNQMRSIAESSSFNGQNWLLTPDGSIEPDRELVNGFIRREDGSVKVTTETFPTLGDGGFGTPTRLIDDGSGTAGMYGILTQPAAASGWDVTIPNWVFMFSKNPWASGREMAVSATTTNQEIDTMITGTEFMQQQMQTAASKLGSIASGIELQTKFVQDLRDATQRGIGRLRDADMNEESTRLKALQVQEQLGIQSLSIANNDADNVIQLFR